MLNDTQIERLLSKLVRFEKTLDSLMFNKIGEADIATEKYETMEQCYDIPEKELFTPCSKGDTWGQEYGYCWFTVKYKVPEEYAGKKLYIYPRTNAYETLLWVNRKPFGTFCSKIVVTGHGNHYCNLLTIGANGGDIIDIALECYSGHSVMGCMPFENTSLTNFQYVFESIDICEKDDRIAEFLFDLKTLNQAVHVLEKNSFRRADIIQTLVQVHQILYYDVENVDRETFCNALDEALPLLKSKLTQSNSETTPYAGFIGHSHMDTAWLWHLDETTKKCARTYSNQISLMEQYDEYTFIQSSAYHSELIRKHYASLFADIQKRVKEGRYEPNGGVWIECDCNITSGESMIRQFLWGQNFTRKYFDYTSNCFWLPDTFGYSASIPQIMKGCGIDYFLTTKMSWNDTTKFPYDTFYWKGIDGTKVLTHLNKTHIWPSPESLVEYTTGRNENSDSIKEKTVSRMRLLSYGFGDGGGGPQFEMIEMSRRIKNFEGLPKSSHTTVGDFMNKLAESIVEPSVYSGELYLELHRGTLTNQHTIKRNNRLLEIALHNLEFATVRDAVDNSVSASDQTIRPLVNTMLVNQFHDILPGTCIPRVHDQCRAEMAEVINTAQNMLINLLETNVSHKEITVTNTLSFERHDVIYIDYEEGYIVDGMYKQQIFVDLHGNKKLAVSGVCIPGFGAVTLKLIPGQIEEKTAFSLDEMQLITPHAIVLFDEKGYISSFTDRRNQRELKGEGYSFNTFLIAEDLPAAWDNWDIDADCELKFRDCAKLTKREIVSDGEVELRIRSQYMISEKSSIRQDMIFYADTSEVRFETIMDWNDHHRLLKTAFDTTIQSDFARHEIQFGYIKRPTTRNTNEEKAKFEVSNHKYTDLSEAKYGVAILNDCKYGISVKDSQLRLTLHKGGCRPDFRGDTGIHECMYSFYPHNEGFSTQQVIKQAYQLNYHTVITKGSNHSASFASVCADNIIIETVKPCEENEKAYILRLYDAEGAYTRTKLSLAKDAVKIEMTNMLEETISESEAINNIELVFNPFEIKTIKVTYA